MSASEYVNELQPGGRLDRLADAAALNVGKPRPHAAALPHPFGVQGRDTTTSSCPCPDCYSARLNSWSS